MPCAEGYAGRMTIPSPSTTPLPSTKRIGRTRLATHASRAVLLASLLSACGGGGGGSSPPVVPPPVVIAPLVVRVSPATPVAAGCNGGRSSGTTFADAEVEPFVAVSPINANHLLGTWQQDRASDGGARALVSAVSFDAGRTWAQTLHPMSRCGGALTGSVGDQERASDPWVDIGTDGTAYMMGLVFSGSALVAGSDNAMVVSRSIDGGRTWGQPVSLQRDGALGFNDKNSLTADPTDARFVYAVWDRLEPSGQGPTLLARSSNAGQSWEPTRAIYSPTVLAGVSQTIGNRIVVLPDGAERGTLVNVFVQIDTAGGTSTTTLRAIRSTDKGLTWGPPVTIADHRSVGTRDPETGAPVRDGAIVPNVVAGVGGMLWVAWQDARFSGGQRDAIAVSRSSDGGRSWSAPLAVNKDASVAAFIPTLYVRADGLVGLMHHDLRSNTADASTLLADLWLLTSRDGQSWTETAVARAFDLNLAPRVNAGLFVGDYQGLVASGNTFIPFAALPGTSAANRTDVLAFRMDAIAAGLKQPQSVAAAHRARDAVAAAAIPGALSDAAFAQARSQAIQRTMESRIPGWRRLVKADPLTP